METLTEMDKLASNLLQKMPEIMEKGVEYGGDLMERFITYSLVCNSLGITVFLFTLSGAITFLIRYNKDDSEFNFGFMVAFCIALLFLTTFSFCEFIPNIVKLLTIPELYVIDYFK